MDGLFEESIREGRPLDPDAREGFAGEYATAYLKLGDFDAALAVASTGATPATIIRINEERDEWIGTSGEVTAMVTLSTDVYSPPNGDALVDDSSDVDDRVCVQCGKHVVAVCGGCRKPNYCSRECQRNHWNAEHRKVCSGPKSIGKCKVCGVGGNLCCSWCGEAVYCTRACRLKDWAEVHKGDCSRKLKVNDD